MLSSNKKITLVAVALSALGLSLSMVSAAEGLTDPMGKAFSDSDIGIALRYRYETVDQDGKPEDAKASTLRTRVNLKSGHIGGFQGFIEIDNVSYIGNDSFNNTENSRTNYPVVADPDYTELNQAHISYTFGAQEDKHNGFVNKATLGRQRITHSGHRFLGNVGWRQNEQTFDAARLELSPSEQLTIDYSYIWRVNRIFGPKGKDNNFTGDSHVAFVTYKINAIHSVSGFAYLLDIEENKALSSNTYGLEYKAGVAINEDISLGVNLSYASQSDAKDNPLNYNADYYLGELTARFRPVTIAFGQEVLESDNGVSFKTPLATLHKFQGFADNFLITPANGIEDSYLQVATTIAGVKLTAVYHDFDAESGSMNYGSEIDFVAAYKFNQHYSVAFKYAAYDAKDFGNDTDKAWLMLSAAF